MSRKLLMYVWLSASHTQTPDGLAASMQALRFEVISATGQRIQSGHAKPADLPRNIPCTLLLHPDDCLLLNQPLPKLSVKQLQEGLAFLIENSLMNAPEDNWVQLLMTLGSTPEGKIQSLVSVMDKSLARNLLEPFVNSPLLIEGLSLEPIQWAPKGQSGWFIASQEYLWVCTPHTAPWALDIRQEHDRSGAMDASALPEKTAAVRLQWWLHNQSLAAIPEIWPVMGATASQQDMLTALLPVPLRFCDRNGLHVQEKAAPSVIPATVLRKIVGSRAQRHANRGWPLIYSMAILLLLGWLMGLNIHAYQQKRRLAQVQALIEQAYDDVLPNTPMLADPILLLEKRRSELQKTGFPVTGGGFVNTLHQAGLAMESLPLNAVDRSLWQNGRLILTLNAIPSAEQKQMIDTRLKNERMSVQWAEDNKKHTTVTLVGESPGARP